MIFPAWPVFLYTNPELGKYLLLPLFKYQETGQYPNKWAVHDMGEFIVDMIRRNMADKCMDRCIVPSGFRSQ